MGTCCLFIERFVIVVTRYPAQQAFEDADDFIRHGKFKAVRREVLVDGHRGNAGSVLVAFQLFEINASWTLPPAKSVTVAAAPVGGAAAAAASGAAAAAPSSFAHTVSVAKLLASEDPYQILADTVHAADTVAVPAAKNTYVDFLPNLFCFSLFNRNVKVQQI
jgi:hypothetical protein